MSKDAFLESRYGGKCFVPAGASGRACPQEPWGLPSDKVTVNASRESVKGPSVDTSTERRVIGSTSETGYPRGPWS